MGPEAPPPVSPDMPVEPVALLDAETHSTEDAPLLAGLPEGALAAPLGPTSATVPDVPVASPLVPVALKVPVAPPVPVALEVVTGMPLLSRPSKVLSTGEPASTLKLPPTLPAVGPLSVVLPPEMPVAPEVPPESVPPEDAPPPETGTMPGGQPVAETFAALVAVVGFAVSAGVEDPPVLPVVPVVDPGPAAKAMPELAMNARKKAADFLRMVTLHKIS